jgi:hypothetical protein
MPTGKVGTQEVQPLANKDQQRCRSVHVAETMAIPARSEALISGQLQDAESVGELWGSLEPTKKRGLSSEVILLLILKNTVYCGTF